MLEEKKAEAAELQKKLDLCQVFPKSYIDAEVHSLLDKVAQVISPAAADAQVVKDLQNTIQTFALNLATTDSVLEVREERQLNK